MLNGNYSYQPEQIVGNYRLLQRLDKDVLHEFWLGEQTRVNAKRLLFLPVHPVLIQNFKKMSWEANLKFDHLQIVRIVESAVQSDLPHIVFSHYSGRSVRGILQIQLTLQVSKALDIVQRLLELLEFIHNRGSLHLNIQPGSVWLNDIGDIRLHNLGIGHVFEESIKKSILSAQNQMVVEELLTRYYFYLSPEQKLDERPDIRSDIYSVGILLFEMLTGHRKSNDFRNDLVAAKIHPNIIDVILRATADRSERYGTVRMMREDVEVLLDKLEAGLLKNEGTGTPSTVSDKDAAPDDQLSTGIQIANQLEIEGRFDEAIDLWNSILKDNPEDRHAKIAIVRINKKLVQGMKTEFRARDHLDESSPGSEKRVRRFRPLFFFFELILLLIIIIMFFNYISRPDRKTAKVGVQSSSGMDIATPTEHPPTASPAPAATRPPPQIVIILPTPEVSQAPTAAPVPSRKKPDPEVSRPRQRVDSVSGLAFIAAGHYWMGSPESEPGRRPDETLRQAQLPFGYYISAHETTQGEWESLMGSNPSRIQDPTLPVNRVNWLEAVVYCNQRSIAEKLNPCYYCDAGLTKPCSGTDLPPDRVYWNTRSDGYRLPLEIEWEYACRSGTSTAYFWGDTWDCRNAMAENDSAAGEDDCSRDFSRRGLKINEPAPVNSFDANPWGIFDMHGNIQEWCWDSAGSSGVPKPSQSAVSIDIKSAKVLRGGSWNHLATACRSAARESARPDYKSSYIGFRVVRSIGSATR